MNDNRLAQIADVQPRKNKQILSKTQQYLSLFGIQANQQVTDKLIQFIQNLPQYKGQTCPSSLNNDWEQRPGVIQNPRQIVSKDSQYTW